MVSEAGGENGSWMSERVDADRRGGTIVFPAMFLELIYKGVEFFVRKGLSEFN